MDNEIENMNYKEELAKLRKENMKIARELRHIQHILERNKSTAIARENIGAIVSAEKNKIEKFMSMVLGNSPNIILLFDKNCHFAYCTDTFLKSMNIKSISLLSGLHYMDVFTYFEDEEWSKHIHEIFQQATLEKQHTVLEEIIHMRSDVSVHNYQIHLIPMTGEKEEFEGIMVFFNDMTDILNAKEEAVKANRAKSDFLSNMLHEMRTPMNAIIGMTSIAQSTNDADKKDYCLEKIDDASKHLLGVINDILDMSKIEANKFELSHSEFNFEKMIMKVVNVTTFRIEEKSQTFSIYIESGIPNFIISDEQRLVQVLTNLISNATKFTSEGGSIKLFAKLIETDGENCTLQMEVKDSGIGISNEQKARLFRSFEQADNNISRKFGGTGLGLVISKRIVEMMGGTIWVESELGKGSRFVFTMQTKKGSASAESIHKIGVKWENLRVLAVDDSPDVCEYFKNAAETVSFNCDTALDGYEAIELIKENRSNPYDVVFVDWKMPGMDGIELIKHIKEDLEAEPIVVMISATEWTFIEPEARLVGVDKFIPKPLFLSNIIDCINECLSISPDLSAYDGLSEEDGCFKGFHILLAEDVEINREILITLLEHTEIEISCAEDGAETVEMFEANQKYDMIFMDIHMPKMDGYEATCKIRNMDCNEAKDIPIIAMTANVFREDIERCLEVGMNGHLGKPLDIAEVIKTLKLYLLKQ